MPVLGLSPDELLTTTRAVRKRLDLSRPVEPEVMRQCLEITLQAPTGANRQGWHFVVVTDAEKRQSLGDLYRRGFAIYRDLPSAAGKLFTDDPHRALIQQRVMDSAGYLAAHMHEIPVHAIPCINGRFEGLSLMQQAGLWGSILPATWSFMLAARARGLGTSWTTIHLFFEQEAAALLGIPYPEGTQAALIPVAYTKGFNFTPAPESRFSPRCIGTAGNLRPVFCVAVAGTTRSLISQRLRKCQCASVSFPSRITIQRSCGPSASCMPKCSTRSNWLMNSAFRRSF